MQVENGYHGQERDRWTCATLLQVENGSQGQERDRGTCATLLQVVESTFADFLFIFSATYVYVKDHSRTCSHWSKPTHTHTHTHTYTHVHACAHTHMPKISS